MRGNLTINNQRIQWQTTADMGFECEKCGYCCTATNVHLTKKDIEKIKEKGIDNFYEPSQAGFRIKGTKTKRCVFLDKNNKCKIYNLRPFVCREYPFKVVFLDNGTAFIDVLYSCKNIIKNYIKNNKKIENKKSNKFYNELIKNSFYLNGRFFNLQEEIDEIEIKLNKKRWKNNISEFNYLNDLLELYKAISPEQGIDFEFFIKKFFTLFKNQMKKESVYRVLDLDKDEFYIIRNVNNDVLIINKNNKQIINIKNIQRKKFNEESKEIIINYLKNYLGRKTTVMDFYFALEHLKGENKEIEINELQREVLKRILLLIQFFILIIGERNNNKEITKKEALETIFALDSTLFTPMEAILPGLGKRFFDFHSSCS